jgi:hypothetical protein
MGNAAGFGRSNSTTPERVQLLLSPALVFAKHESTPALGRRRDASALVSAQSREADGEVEMRAP